MSRAPFIPVPSALQHATHLSRGARDLWVLLDDLARDGGTIHAGLAASRVFLARALGCSVESLKRYRVELVRTGWLVVEPARHRGEVSVWVPQHRARPVIHRGVITVAEGGRKGVGRGSPVTPSHQAKGVTGDPLPEFPYKDRAGEEEEGPAPRTSAHPRPWCGRCTSEDYRWIELDDGRPARCADCHPATVPVF